MQDNSATGKPAIFLDRDGTITKEAGNIGDISLVEFYPYTVPALKTLQKHFLLFIITNQSGVSKGLITLREVALVNRYIADTLDSSGINIVKTFCCTHKAEDKCRCRKPSPFFIQSAAARYNIVLRKSFIIGDHPSDAECGINAGITPLYLLSGHGEKHRPELRPDVVVCNDLKAASVFILKKINNN